MDETKPRRKAEDNPWYRLATLHGEPSSSDDELAVKNRVTWNRWMASKIPDDLKASLIKAGRCSAEELIALSERERRDIQLKIGNDVSNEIDLSDLKFEKPFFAGGFLLPNANFENATFSNYASFARATFVWDANFENATFYDHAGFGSATFSGAARFARATFVWGATFARAIFSSHASFASAAFSGGGGFADFADATFSGANFERATFSGADFTSATFAGGREAYFGSATFSGVADFASAAFSDHAFFASTTFNEGANFEKVTFAGLADFANVNFSIIAIFVNAKMENETDFNGAKFATPPRLFGAKLHEGTTWHDVEWPMQPDTREAARQFVDAYERLKLEMDRLKKHGDELDFFALEQQSRRVLLGWKGLPIAVYGFLGDYGRSYVRPLSLIGATVLVGAFFFVAHLVGFWIPALADLGHTGQAIGLSFANTFGILGIRKDLIEPAVLQGLPGWLKVIATIQTILGIVLLFLFGLGIRNRFRMK